VQKKNERRKSKNLNLLLKKNLNVVVKLRNNLPNDVTLKKHLFSLLLIDLKLRIKFNKKRNERLERKLKELFEKKKKENRDLQLNVKNEKKKNDSAKRQYHV